MVIRKTPPDLHPRAQFPQGFLKRLGHRDRADRTHPFVLQKFEGLTLPRENIFQVDRPVRAFDDLRRAIPTPDLGDEFFVRTAIAFGQQNKTRALKVARRLAQRSARQHRTGAKGRARIDQHHIQAMREIEILHAIVEQQEIRSQMVDRKSAALHAVAVDQHRDAIEIARKHERLVAGVFGIEQQGSASRYHLRHLIEWHMPTLGVLPALRTIKALTLITTRQNRDLAPALAQRLC